MIITFLFFFKFLGWRRYSWSSIHKMMAAPLVLEELKFKVHINITFAQNLYRINQNSKYSKNYIIIVINYKFNDSPYVLNLKQN